MTKMTMLAVKNFFLPERKQQPAESGKFSRMPETFLRSIRRRSLRVKRTKSLMVAPDRAEKRKSDSFVNSQEWTISRAVPDLRLGIVGSLNSGKSALVHRYLTGAYMQEESPEGGRFKKEIFIDNSSYLLLIRDEGGLPEMQFSAWVDAVIFVFSLENESSFNAIYNFYTKMSHFRNSTEVPIILVGTQDGISERTPRVIDETRARKLASDLKRCSYYETCATYGLNVERVFQDACQKIVQQRMAASTQCLTPTNSRPTTPQGPRLGINSFHHGGNNGVASPTNGFASAQVQTSAAAIASNSNVAGAVVGASMHPSGNFTLPHRHHALSASSHHIPIRINAGNSEHHHGGLQQQHQLQQQQQQQTLQLQQSPNKWGGLGGSATLSHGASAQALSMAVDNNNVPKFSVALHHQQQPQQSISGASSISDNHSGSSSNATAAAVAAAATGGRNSTTSTTSTANTNSITTNSSSAKDLPTPTSTPTTSRKSRRRSNLFIPSSKKSSANEEKLKNGAELGSGRAIPIKQGYLYKRSSKSLNKEWKKKYVTLCDDGRLTYHPSLHDYMDDVHGKEVSLQYVTVKVPGQKPRGSKSIITNSALHAVNVNWRSSAAAALPVGVLPVANGGGLSEGLGGLTLAKDKRLTAVEATKVGLLSAFDAFVEPAGVKSSTTGGNSQTSGDEGIVMSNSNSQTFLAGGGGGVGAGGGGGDLSKVASAAAAAAAAATQAAAAAAAAAATEAQTPNVKKRHRRMKSSGVKNNEYDDSDAFEFYIVSLDNKQWHFEAATSDERDEWVSVIEQEIFKSLQANESAKVKQLSSSEVASMQSIRSRVPGNGFCVDCDAPNPEWASLNLGILMCIECSGIHRNLGSHISKVRSLGLDDWPPSHIAVMLSIGNALANSVWESAVRLGTSSANKPTPASSREDKEHWIRCKYEAKEFVPSLSATASTQQLVEAVVKADMKTIVLLVAHASTEQINATVSQRDHRTPLHLACAIGNLAIAQLLIWNHANIKLPDHEGRTALTYARAAASLATAQQQQLLNQQQQSQTNSSSSTGGGSSGPHYSVESTSALVDVLTGLGCPDAPLQSSSQQPQQYQHHSNSLMGGTLPRRRETLGATAFDKMQPPASAMDKSKQSSVT